jgi:hypothetical protein
MQEDGFVSEDGHWKYEGLQYLREGDDFTVYADDGSYRQKYRDELTKCLETNPCSFRNTIARELAPNATSRLRKNDKDWLLCVLPPVRPRAGPRGRANWEIRDTELAARVPAAIDRLLSAPGLPRRITAQQIICALGFSGGLPDPARLQRTVALINTAVESLEECAIRRLNRFVWMQSSRADNGPLQTCYECREFGNHGLTTRESSALSPTRVRGSSSSTFHRSSSTTTEISSIAEDEAAL